MSDAVAGQTAAQDRVPIFQKIAYGLGSLANNLVPASLGCMVVVLNLGLKMDPEKIGLILAISKLVDAIADPVIGYISDHTSFRWGRRRPYIIVGVLLTGLIYALMWQLPAGHSQTFYFWFFLLGTSVLFIVYPFFSVPFVGLGYEMTADYHERTRIQAYANFIGQVAWTLVPWFWKIMFNTRYFADGVEGARTLAIGVGASIAILGLMPGLFCKEPFFKIASKGQGQGVTSEPLMDGLLRHVKGFFKGFWITLRNRRFLQLSAATFLIFNGFQMIAGLGPYTITYYLFGGDKEAGGNYIGWFGSLSAIFTFAIILGIASMAGRIDKRKAFMATTLIAIFGYAIKYPLYQPSLPWLILLSAPFVAFGLGGLFTTVAAMIADVCDEDELQTGQRREATFGAIYWWMVKLGMAVALAASGYLLKWTGFHESLGGNQTASTLFQLRAFEVGIPIVAYALAIWVMYTYDLDQSKAKAIRAQLEARRGTAA